jgi:endonuclease III
VARPPKRALVDALLDRHGRTYAEELRINVAKGTPSPLFRLLCAAMLMSARISASIATEAARGLARRGWRTSAKLAASSWDERVEALNRAGYTRYQERTATMLGELAELLEERYGGDLRRLRDAADRDPEGERRLLKQFKGVGDVGVDIFFREVQVSWPELRPFADRRALDAASRLGLGKDVRALARLCGDGDVARLVAALVRVELEDDYDGVREAARGR